MDKRTKTELILEFLKESNAIEDIWDADSLLQAYYAWEYLRPLRKIKPGDILKTHKILMLRQTGLQPNERGYFRRCQVSVGGHEGTAWGQVPERVAQWCEANKGDKTEDDIKNLHVEFEKIHPFIDGNGRVGRILMNWAGLKNGLDILVIYEKEKRKYYDWFR